MLLLLILLLLLLLHVTQRKPQLVIGYKSSSATRYLSARLEGG